MARPKKDKKIEAPEESLEAVLNPGYTLETVQELTVIGPSTETGNIENHEFFTLPESPEEPAGNVRRGLIGFNVVQDLNTFSPYVQMIIRFEGLGTRKLESKYVLENVMDALALGVKVDALEQIKKAEGNFGFDLNVQDIKTLGNKMPNDFSRFYDELRRNGMILKIDLTVQMVSLGIHTHDPIAALIEVIQ